MSIKNLISKGISSVVHAVCTGFAQKDNQVSIVIVGTQEDQKIQVHHKIDLDDYLIDSRCKIMSQMMPVDVNRRSSQLSLGHALEE